MTLTSWREELTSNEHLRAFISHASLKSIRTEESYFHSLKMICETFEVPYSEFDPGKLTQQDYDTFLQKNSKRWKKGTLNIMISVFRILNDLYELDIKAKKLKETDKEKTDHVTFDELQDIINKADKEAATLAAFMFCTGLRPVSILNVKKSQLMLDAEHPYIKNVYLKGGKRQDIVFLYPEIVVPLLRWYMTFKAQNQEDYSEDEMLLVSQKGKTGNSYVYKKIRDGCTPILKRKVTPRMFRKGLGVHTKELGFQDEVRRMIMGHSDVKTTIDAYSDYDVKDIMREIEAKTGNRHEQPTAGFINQTFQKEKERCRFCGGFVDENMVRCPHCWERIKVLCPGCQRFVNSNWEICAYCETPLRKDKKHVIGLKR